MCGGCWPVTSVLPNPADRRPGGRALLLPDAAPWQRWGSSGWRVLAAHLQAQEVAVVTASPDEPALDTVTVDPQPRLCGWRLIVGVNNATTWAAVAAGVPTVVLLGPDASPLADDPAGAGVRRVGDAWLVQSRAYCVPCGQRGCSDAPDSPALCLDWLAARTVLRAVDAALALPKPVSA